MTLLIIAASLIIGILLFRVNALSRKIDSIHYELETFKDQTENDKILEEASRLLNQARMGDDSE